MDSSGFSFIIMVKGIKDFISSQVRKQKGIFENSWGNFMCIITMKAIKIEKGI